jgi:hypothetical protein
MVALERAVEYARRLVEVGDVPILLQAVQRMGNGHLVVGFEARTPEPAKQLHLRVIHFFQPMQRRRIGPRGGARKTQGNSETSLRKSAHRRSFPDDYGSATVHRVEAFSGLTRRYANPFAESEEDRA